MKLDGEKFDDDSEILIFYEIVYIPMRAWFYYSETHSSPWSALIQYYRLLLASNIDSKLFMVALLQSRCSCEELIHEARRAYL
jgi:hypothetical protein